MNRRLVAAKPGVRPHYASHPRSSPFPCGGRGLTLVKDTVVDRPIRAQNLKISPLQQTNPSTSVSLATPGSELARRDPSSSAWAHSSSFPYPRLPCRPSRHPPEAHTKANPSGPLLKSKGVPVTTSPSQQPDCYQQDCDRLTRPFFPSNPRRHGLNGAIARTGQLRHRRAGALWRRHRSEGGTESSGHHPPANQQD